MTDDLKKEVPEAVRKIVGAAVSQALARCDRQGIAWEDFYRVLLEEQKLHPSISVPELFERTFRRLEGTAN
jgi:hypothetical protein